MPSRTQIVCLHEGKKGSSIDPIFINALIHALRPTWIRQHTGSNLVRLEGCGNRAAVIAELPRQLRFCIRAGGQTTLMVWADMDHDTANGEELKQLFWQEAKKEGITQDEFDQIVFIFAKDRIENWVEFLRTGATSESREGPRVTFADAADAAKKLAKRCQQNIANPTLPPSLEWSCRNWRKFVDRMKDS